MRGKCTCGLQDGDWVSGVPWYLGVKHSSSQRVLMDLYLSLWGLPLQSEALATKPGGGHGELLQPLSSTAEGTGTGTVRFLGPTSVGGMGQ